MKSVIVQSSLGAFVIAAITYCLMSASSAFAQSPTEYATLKAAGNVALTGATKQVTAPDPKDAAKQITSTVRDTDQVIVAPTRYDPITGAKVPGTPTTYSISGLQKDIANLQAQLAAAQAMLADLQAVK